MNIRLGPDEQKINDISLVSQVSRPHNQIGLLMNGKTGFARFSRGQRLLAGNQDDRYSRSDGARITATRFVRQIIPAITDSPA